MANSTQIPEFSLLINGRYAVLISFQGQEELNRLSSYSFVIDDTQNSWDIDDLSNQAATFTLHEYNTNLHRGDLIIEGYISAVSSQGERWLLTLHPNIYRSSQNKRSEIYYRRKDNLGDLSVLDILEQELIDDSNSSHSSFKETNSSEINLVIQDSNITELKQSIFCQYHESDFNFIGRLCDHWGIHFYFDNFRQQITFANDTNYDKVIAFNFSTSRSVDKNSETELYNWSMNSKPFDGYITIKGYNPISASTDIISSFPHSEEGIHKAITYSDIENNETAELLAKLRYEQTQSLTHTVTCSTAMPYAIPGFLINTDNTGSFAEALVIASLHSAIELERIGETQRYSGQYEAQLILTPGDKIFRPQPFYPTPKTNSTTGKIISDSESDSVAQRNELGEYKVSLLGFDPPSTSAPWLRKAQASAGQNSHDISLLPGTEVSIRFHDNNPNCPIIEYALENSLHPSPVNSANPRHSVTATNGTMINSALMGRSHYTTTPQYHHNEAVIPFNSNFQTDKFFDTASTNASSLNFPDEYAASGEYVFNEVRGDQVHIAEGNQLAWHKGNTFNFSASKNFNITARYREDINLDDYNKNNSSQSDLDFYQRDNDELTFNSSNTVTENYDSILDNSDYSSIPFNQIATEVDIIKSYRDQYHYHVGSEIKVRDKGSLISVVNYGDDTVDITMEYDNGELSSWSDGDHSESFYDGNKVFESHESEDGSGASYTKTENEISWNSGNSSIKVSEATTTTLATSVTTDEKSYNINTGALASHSINKSDGMGISEMNFSYAETNSANFEFGGSRSFSIAAQGTASIAISFSGSFDMNIGFGAAIAIETGVSASIELDLRVGSVLQFSDKGKLEWETIGLSAIMEARPAISTKTTGIQKVYTKLESIEANIKASKIGLKVSNLDVAIGTSLLGL